MLKCFKYGEKIAEIDLICETQGKIYRTACFKYDMPCFSTMYLKSKFCESEMDTMYSTWHYQDEDVILEMIEYELGLTKSSKPQMYEDEAFWVGYMYRYLYYITELTSKELAEIIPYDEMVRFIRLCEDFEIEDMAEYIATNCNI